MNEPSKDPQPLVLFINVGSQDIKYWGLVKGEASKVDIARAARCKEKRATPEELNSMREKHQALLGQGEAWVFVDSSRSEDLQAHSPNRPATAKAQSLASNLGCKQPLFTENGLLALCAAKVETIIQGIISSQSNFKVVGAVVFYTERTAQDGKISTSPKDLESEPIANGKLIAKYLEQRIGLDPEFITAVNAMSGLAGRTEGAIENADDIPLRREIISRIDDGIHGFINRNEKYGIGDAVPVLISTGGMGSFKQVLPGLVSLRFNSPVRDLSFPDVRGVEDTVLQRVVGDRLCQEQPSVSRYEAIEARSRALYLVLRGDFAGAWSSVSQLSKSAADAWWLRPLHAVATYFGGQVGVSEAADVTCEPYQRQQETILNCLNSIDMRVESLDQRYQRYALNAAMRLECACQGPSQADARIADALIALSGLIDTLVVAQAARIIEDPSNGFGFSQTTQGDQFSLDPPDDTFHDHLFVKKNAKYRIRSNASLWHDQFSRDFSSIYNLDTKFESAMNADKRGGFPNLRGFRNSAAHRALSSDDISEISGLGTHKKLWRFGAMPIGQHVLAKADSSNRWPGIVDSALQEAGIEDAHSLYLTLVQGLIQLLREPEPSG